MIEGVHVTPLKQIPDERGKISHMVRCDSPGFDRFGEIYFSSIWPGVIKGWHIHKEMTLNYAVPVGHIKLVLFDERPDSPTRGEVQEIYLGESNYCLVTVPPMVWNGFKGIGDRMALVANCATIPHHPDEIMRCDPLNNHIPYDWALKHR
jgi:dTDP-4-dehydrorhamnose 3,5-epimerase